MTHSTLTSKGQTTVPVQVRRALRLSPGDRVIYEVRGDYVVLRRDPGVMAAFGALKPSPDKANVPFKEARRKARQAWAKEVAREGQS